MYNRGLNVGQAAKAEKNIVHSIKKSVKTGHNVGFCVLKEFSTLTFHSCYTYLELCLALCFLLSKVLDRIGSWSLNPPIYYKYI